jgi:hypothetical protein
MNTPVWDVAVGSIRLVTESPQSAVPTMLILTPDRLVFGQTSIGVGALRWLPLDSVVNLDAIDSASGTILYYEILLTGGIALAVQCPEAFMSAFVNALTAGPSAPTEEPTLEEVLPPIVDDASSLDALGPPSLTEAVVPSLDTPPFDPFAGLGPVPAFHDDPCDRTAETPSIPSLPISDSTPIFGEPPRPRDGSPTSEGGVWAPADPSAQPLASEASFEGNSGQAAHTDRVVEDDHRVEFGPTYDASSALAGTPASDLTHPLAVPVVPEEPSVGGIPGPGEVHSAGLPVRTPGAAYAGNPQTNGLGTPSGRTPGAGSAAIGRDAHADLTAPLSPPYGQPVIHGAVRASGETPVVADAEPVDDLWMEDLLDDADTGGTPSWAGNDVSTWERWPEGTPNIAVPAGYTSEEINFGIDDFADLAGEFDEKNVLSELEDMPPAPPGMSLIHAIETNWWSELADWPEAFRSVTYLGGHPKHAKRRKNVTLHFTPMGLGVTTGGLKNWAMEIPWSRVRWIDIEGSDELMFRSSLRIDLSSSALVVDTDEGTVFFECRLRRPASVRSSLAPMINAMSGNS